MQCYRDALNHLNAALDAMIETGDTLMIAAITHPIAVAERHILERQTAIIRQHFASVGITDAGYVDPPRG